MGIELSDSEIHQTSMRWIFSGAIYNDQITHQLGKPPNGGGEK